MAWFEGERTGPLMIDKPFASYHRAKLERLVLEGFEAVERKWVVDGYKGVMARHMTEFMVLTAADKYLRNTAKK